MEFVGLLVGFLGLPDKSQGCSLNKLAAKCRVCRVFIGVESPGEFAAIKIGTALSEGDTNWTVAAWRPFLDSSWTPGAHFKPGC
jgi:hypothetical protein